MKKNALILFVRNPEPGKVKTRLAATIGDEEALAVYQQLLQLTHDMALGCDADRFLYYAGGIPSNDLWENEYFIKREQAGQDLGDRMCNAFREVLNMGYRGAVIAGSDCPGLTAAMIHTAFDQLDKTDVVIGPASDGGYYLLGMKELLVKLFVNKSWGTDQVLNETIGELHMARKNFELLHVLSDIDTADDLEQYGWLFPGKK